MRGSVRGTIVRAENDDPIAGVTIMGSPGAALSADQWGAPPRPALSARSDRSGGFGFDNLPEGKWVFTSQGAQGEVLGEATVHVFDNALSDVTIAVRGMRISAPVDVDQDVEPPKAYKTKQPLLGGVRGRVVRDINGKAVPGVTIAVVSGEGSEPDVAPVTDAEGWFALDGLPEGEWLLRALGRAGETGTATVHVFDNALSEVTIEVGGVPPRPQRRGGGTRPSNKSERSMRGSLRGRVVRKDTGEPVADATITVVSGPGPAPDIAPLTNDDGAFSLDGLPPGDWVLRAMTTEGGTSEGRGRVTAGGVSDMTIYV
jgi:uncharacterized GH25 family protein